MNISLLRQILAIFIATAALSSCVITQDKTMGESFSDTTIWTKIRVGLANRKIDNVLGTINIEVHEGRVLLTGTVLDKDKIIKILETCWDVTGVREVINELRIKGQDDDYDGFDKTKDAWITTKVKSKLLASKQVKSVNYSVETIQKVVYLFGMAQSQDELDKVIQLVSDTTGVKRVISYVKVKKSIQGRLAETKGIKIEQGERPYNFSDDGHEVMAPQIYDSSPPSGNGASTNAQAPSTSPNVAQSKKAAANPGKIFERDDY